MSDLKAELLETWRISHRIGLYLLDSLADEALDDVGPTKGRSVRLAFAHLHDVRLMWLKSGAPELLQGLEKLGGEGACPSREALRAGLDASAKAVAEMLSRGIDAGTIKGFKPHPTAFLGYLVAHEAHHRGQIMLALKANQHLDKKVQFGLWEWGVR